MMARVLRWVVCAAALVSAGGAVAAPCAGFTDVDDTSPFCPNVDWLRNRGITLGCNAPGTLFCPGTDVSRLAMAAFMHRLGMTLTPTVMYGEQSGGTLTLASAPPAVCATADLAVAAYPRHVHAGAVLSGLASGTATVQMRIVQSTNSGATWTPLSALPSSVGGDSEWINGTAWQGVIPLQPNIVYRFGLEVSGGGTLASWNCQLQAKVVSRTGASFPF